MSLLDLDGEDGGMEDTFFPGSDDELGFMEDEGSGDESDSEEQKYVKRVIRKPCICKNKLNLPFFSDLVGVTEECELASEIDEDLRLVFISISLVGITVRMGKGGGEDR